MNLSLSAHHRDLYSGNFMDPVGIERLSERRRTDYRYVGERLVLPDANHLSTGPHTKRFAGTVLIESTAPCGRGISQGAPGKDGYRSCRSFLSFLIRPSVICPGELDL